jgi:hypothetical protein
MLAKVVDTLVTRRLTMRIPLFGMHTRYATASGLALALALLAVPAIGAEAKWTRHSAFDCFIEPGAAVKTYPDIYTWRTDMGAIVLCPVPDTDYFTKDDIWSLNVHVYNGNTSYRTYAIACSTRWHTTGGSCGNVAYAPYARQDYTLRPEMSAWQGNTDFGYIWVFLPWVEAGHASRLRGYFTSSLAAQ